MMRSQELRNLDKRVRKLRARYLPRNFSPTGSYSDDVYSDTAAFILLAHAEFETFLERLVIGRVTRILGEIAAGRIPPQAGATLVALFNRQTSAPPSEVADIRASQYLHERMNQAAHAIRLKAEGNNGIRTSNVLGLFICLGLDETQVELDLLRALDDFGSKRGAVAHHALHDIALLPDPKEAKNRVYEIVTKFAVMERCIPV